MKTSKATKEALSGLEWAIAQTIETPRQPDEFTLLEYMEALGIESRNVALRRLEAIKPECRKVVMNGTRTNLYRRAK